MAQFTSNQQPTNRKPRGKNKNPSLDLIKKAQPQIIQSLIASALDGDISAANILLKRVMPELKSTATGAELAQVEAQTELTNLKCLEVRELENRITAIEEAQANE